MTERRAGILVHVTSLSGPYGSGDLGPGATRFLDWAAEAGLGLWQFLPLGPTGPGGSPYTSPSTFAGNPRLVSPSRLRHAGWLDEGDARTATDREPLLRRAYARFCERATPRAREAFRAFREDPDRTSWLADWALYAALKDRYDGRPWYAWDEELRTREPGALRRAGRELRREIDHVCYAQYVFHRQWEGLHRAARTRNIALMGDLPYYVAYDSADVWAHRRFFRLDDQGRRQRQAGVPPDYFSETGQLWGNPTYAWDRLRDEGFGWWIERIRQALLRVDCLRLDHFRGFAAYWEVAAEARDARAGEWVTAPGTDLFEALSRRLGALPLVAEDLGVITDDVDRLRERFGLPRMHVLQFAFGEEADNIHRPERHEAASVVYTGTHDNDTTRGWFESLGPAERERVVALLGEQARDPAVAVERLVETALASPARTAIVPLQDLLGLGSDARMNRPGVAEGNWGWRVPRGALSLALAARIRRSLARSGRLAS